MRSSESGSSVLDSPTPLASSAEEGYTYAYAYTYESYTGSSSDGRAGTGSGDAILRTEVAKSKDRTAAEEASDHVSVRGRLSSDSYLSSHASSNAAGSDGGGIEVEAQSGVANDDVDCAASGPEPLATPVLVSTIGKHASLRDGRRRHSPASGRDHRRDAGLVRVNELKMEPQTAARVFPQAKLELASSGGEGVVQRLTLLMRIKLFLLRFESLSSKHRRYWNLFLLLVVVVQGVTVPMRIAYRKMWQLDQTFFYVFSAFTDVVLLADIVLHFRSVYVDRSIPILDYGKIRGHYLRTRFPLHALASLPLDWIFLSPVWLHATLRLPRLLRLLEMRRFVRAWDERSQHLLRTRLLFLLVVLLLLVHWIGCVYTSIEYERGFGATSWSSPTERENAPLWEQFVAAYFWALNQVTNKGGTPLKPVTQFERGFELGIAVLSLFVVATVISAISRLIVKAGAKDARLATKSREVTAFIKQRNLPTELADAIKSHVLTVHEREEDKGAFAVYAALPEQLKRDVAMCLKAELLSQVPFLAEASDGFVESIAVHLKATLFSPGEMIVQQGAKGGRMYFVESGHVARVESGKVLNRLAAGEVFGVTALLLPHLSQPFGYSALSFASVYTLSRKHLSETLKFFPAERAKLRDRAYKVANERAVHDALDVALNGEDSEANRPRFSFSQLVALRAEFEHVVYGVGEEMFAAGAPADQLVFVVHGQVSIYTADGDPLGVVAHYSFIGGLGPPPAVLPVSGRAGGVVHALWLPRQAFDAHVAACSKRAADALEAWAARGLEAGYYRDHVWIERDGNAEEVCSSDESDGNGNGEPMLANDAASSGKWVQRRQARTSLSVRAILADLADIASSSGHALGFASDAVSWRGLSNQTLLRAARCAAKLRHVVDEELFTR
ncbi:uncharacterized protein AMSG_02067 [Thecamonas trahens ATCC 50062]|uniref:Cyclic nucleotide-binding domain-containing protein n=1 Tax=Thecamonas trahens ATCC 50062 TaxID=461836 RepID=A0A0L0DV03_THETB|nr:hypothetical protein AMSG_02067 [Thecamonas trahens ATCC 50062]KNC56055.1 hypothetical protein AMSG_02067 [Thecamonas trahens ATCC 50062]|eukprot:XP_013761099.1 hypothetical protein AMSG_02067 [Thecamonas trahens ATCC 50062]